MLKLDRSCQESVFSNLIIAKFTNITFLTIIEGRCFVAYLEQ